MNREENVVDWILDRLIPSYDFRSRYARDIAASPEQVWHAMHALTTAELPLTRVLMGIRSAGRAHLHGRLMDAVPLPPLGRVPAREAVNGAVAQFWRRKPVSRLSETETPEGFRTFSEPGWAKAAMSLQLIPIPGGTRLAAETRIKATDPASRRRFAAYWLLIAAGGGLIRIEWLRAIGRRAERGSGVEAGRLAAPDRAAATTSGVVLAAAAWALLFAAGSFYMALGGRHGATTVAPAITDRLLRDDPGMIRALWLTGCLKVALAGFLLGAARLPMTVRLRQWSGWIVQGIGVLLALWGLAEGLVGLLVSTAVIAPPDGWGDGAAALFYAALWGPFWLLGGVLYILSGRRVTKPAPGRHPPAEAA